VLKVHGILAATTCEGGTSTTSGGLALGTPSEALIGPKSSTNAFDILVAFPLSHNVVAN
jgi:hypothetical protein